MYMRGAARLGVAIGLLGVTGACGDPLGPAANLTLLVSATPGVVVLGDTVELTGVAYNGASATIDAGVSCAPGIRFTVTNSVGSATDLYDGLAFICPRLDSQDLEPGETDVVEWRWVPNAVGEYTVRSTVMVKDGPTVRSRGRLVRVLAQP